MKKYRIGTGTAAGRAAFARALRVLEAIVPKWPNVSAGLALPRASWIFLAVFAAGMALISLIGDQGLIAYRELRSEADRLRVDVVQMEARKIDLVRIIKSLHEDPDYIEQVARQKLGLVRPGELVLQIPPMSPLMSPPMSAPMSLQSPGN
ncbi:MAG: septum formation initiator family protein [SAR324 cluster bacterium]|nr:septum formation initiator family protein [SAR324 cluster bacterium]